VDLTVGPVPAAGTAAPFGPGQIARVTEGGEHGEALLSLVAENPAGGLRLVVTYRGQELQKIFTGSPVLGRSGETFLVARRGFFVTRPRMAGEAGAIPAISAHPLQRCLGGESGEALDVDDRQVPRILGFRFVPEIGGGCIVAQVDRAEAFAGLRETTSLLVVATAFFMVFGSLAAAWLAKRLVEPFVALTGVARSLAQGDFTRRVGVGGYAEVAELSRLFNDLGAQLGETIGRLQASKQNLETEVQERTEALRRSEERYRSIVQDQTELVCRYTPDCCLLFVNDAYARCFGTAAEELVGQCFLQFIPEGEHSRVLGFLAAFTPDQPVRTHEHPAVDGRGCVRWQQWTDRAFFDEEGRCIEFQGVARDITEHKRAEQELRIAAAAFETQEGITVTDAEHVIVRVNRAFTEITGYTAEEAIGNKPSLLKSGRQDDAFYRAMYETLHRDGIWQGEIWDRHKDGHIYPKWLAITAVKDGEGRVTHYVGSFADITERKVAEEKIRALAFYDTLTELPNRRLLYERLTHAIAASQRSGGHGALLYLDLDNFKTLNDTQGHPVGDELLAQAAQRLKDCVREVDTVARLGGDEFVVLLEDLDPDNEAAVVQAKSVAEKIVSAFAEPFVLSSGEHHGSTSIGIALFVDQEAKPDIVLASADTAMYEAKRNGKNAYRFFDAAMQYTLEQRVAMESSLRQALANREFQLFYQPQVDGENCLTGLEALLRWRHPTRGLIPPDEFIPLAEETGMIHNLGRWVLETACAQLKDWESLPVARELNIAVNISPKQFHHPAFVEEVREIMTRYTIDPAKLTLELTENMVMEPVEEAVGKMQRLKSLGLALSMDDFGTGYSSLSYLKNLPFDQTKIDKSFVAGIQENAGDAFIASTVITMGKLLEMNVIAEGVEDKDQHEALKQLGCRAFQGYLFGRPAPVGEVEDRFSPPE
ncbi:MAG TPA: EAL domain-containing protein, partial [Methylococcaceae bacterium]|nr:EAL domain-containing protein [Methylococcaceae bacterium]